MAEWILCTPRAEDEAEALAFSREYAQSEGAFSPVQGGSGLEKLSQGGLFVEWLAGVQRYKKGVGLPEGHVPSDCWFLRQAGQDRIYGLVSIRHRLTPGLLTVGGHIGYSIRPTERRKGLGSLQLALALKKCRELGIERALVTCNEQNTASAGVILSQGGLEDTPSTTEDGTCVRRFWIPTGERLVLRKAQDMPREWVQQAVSLFTQAGEGRIYGASGVESMPYEDWMAKLHRYADEASLPEGLVPQVNYLSLLLPAMTPVGFIAIRKRLSESLLAVGGHIGYSICPDQRRKGFGKQQLRMALSRLYSAGVAEALVTCDADNQASAATARSCGGVEAEPASTDHGLARRFWLPTMPR